MNITIDDSTAEKLLELTRRVKKMALDRGFSEEVCATVLLKQLIVGALMEDKARDFPHVSSLADLGEAK
ncbi:hypothetical protein [Paraburkholderia sediminicola]|uniref:hypothetical protein n=1 Tax=Paraburkholderia sediminicola TaxID=458836 RepID=UPI0038B72C20